MKLRDKIKSYSFWVSLTSAIILILKILGTRFGFVVDETMVSDLFTALCSILVLLGIIVPPQNISNISPKTTNINNLSKTTQQPVQINQKTENKIPENKQSVLTIENINTIDESEPITENVSENINEVISTNQEQKEPLTKKSEQLVVEISSEIINENSISDNQPNKEFSIDEISTKSNNQEKENIDLKQMFFEIKEKFSGNLDSYIFELQEEIRKTREGM